MTVFAGYARYYDLLNRDKDYRSETEYVVALLRKHAPGARSILELGCGTGRHALLFAELGYTVRGVDLSAEMLALAVERRDASSAETRACVQFSQGDVRTYRADQTFDAVASLFHVFSYQTSNADLQAAFETAACHLLPGGILVCDFWYGPAVLAQRPEVRVKRLAGVGVDIVRIAEPVLHEQDNVVDVNYEITSVEQSTSKSATFTEQHRMRYIFLPELELIADRYGLALLESNSWLSNLPPSADSWSVCAVLVKR